MKIIAVNKYARSDYEILDTYETGIQLLGWEVKSIRAGHIVLKSSYITIKNNELFLTNCFIKQYMAVEADETQHRKLLMHKNQIKRLNNSVSTKGGTIIPLKIYFTKNSWIKLEIAHVKHRNKHDKRQYLKEQDLKKEIKDYLK